MKKLATTFTVCLFVLVLFSCSTSNDNTDDNLRLNIQPEKLYDNDSI